MTTALSPKEALTRVAHLLESEGVSIERDEAAVHSLRTPIPLINLDRRLYSRRNWVGINPFVLLTGLKISTAANDGGASINISVDRRRMVLLVAIEALTVLSVAFRAPPLVSLAIAAFLLGVCALLLRWGVTLTKAEIEQELRT